MGVSEDEGRSAFQEFKATLDPATVAVLDSVAAPSAESDWPEAARPQYCIIEIADGEWPVLRVTRDPVVAARKLHELESDDVVAYVIYGVPVPFTQGPNRHLILPDNTAIELATGRRVREMPGQMLVQENGFLGDPMLAVTTGRDREAEEAAGNGMPVRRTGRTPPPPSDPDDDPDDEDDQG